MEEFSRDRGSLDLGFPCCDIALVSRQGITKACGDRVT